MFQVESNAARNAEKLEKELVKRGVRPAAAAERAEKARLKEIAEGNKWILDNVNLD